MERNEVHVARVTGRAGGLVYSTVISRVGADRAVQHDITMKQMNRFLAVLTAVLLCTFLGIGCVTRQLWQGTEHEPASPPRLALSPDGADVLVSYEEARVQPFRELKPMSRRYWLFASTNRLAKSAPEFEERNHALLPTLRTVRLDTAPTNVVLPIDAIRATFSRALTNRADRKWLDQGTNSKCVTVGTNVSGEQLYICDTPPTNAVFWRLTAKPPRYVWTTNNPIAAAQYVVACGDQFALWRNGEIIGPFRLPHYVTYAHANAARVLLTPLTATIDAALWSPVIAVLAVGMGGGIPK